MVLALKLKAHLSCRVKSEGRTRGMDAERAVLEQEANHGGPSAK
ncbi:hypothetical protein ACMVCI_000635 [Yersinia enterocolitica]|uniref:Uncharacterized protein n=1 Tax=Yersinia enterocolitica TaxID=630 RepID=A0A9P1M3M1_YEREN|nr:hypothetical protein [Yersinia enterocolitica]UXD28682.1 hypothetical protein FORC066_1467 [Yersinia enterocolitica]CFQ85828.1 Uncharacterised protein [Yersinia enterocolitica]CNE50051.1 Uncharacterised protein [Yersinia enterocolitica]CNF01422.1 Uncharacterised protein [Yersinia enterocolitica]CNF26810.1 Uncharacterised protein [Yersinia enterocolitica]